MADKKIKLNWELAGEIVLYIFALVCFVYSGKFLMAHQMEVLEAVRSIKF
jgi:hypothetical protein